MNLLNRFIFKDKDGGDTSKPPSTIDKTPKETSSSVKKFIGTINVPSKTNSLAPKSPIMGLTVSIDTSDSAANNIQSSGLSPWPHSLPAESTPNQPTRHVDSDLDIEEGTPAFDALRANANVNVSKVSKAARYLGFENITRAMKKAMKITGEKRGKPPRVPAIDNESESNALEVVNESLVDEEDEESSLPIDLDSPMSNVVVSLSSELEQEAKHSLVLLDTKGKKREVRMDRKTRRQMKKMEKKKTNRNYVKGKVIDGTHELYALSIAMMLGLRYTIFLTNKQLLEDKQNNRFWLDSDEFMKVEKYIFRPDGSRGNTPPHQLRHTFKFKDYSPLPFAYLRRMFGVNEFEFHHSVCGNASFIEFISNAKSGQFFFYSSDGKYMIKTMTNTESKFLRRILPHYFRHCAQNPNTILTKFLGMYRVKLYHLRRRVKFVIMNSVFDTDRVLSSFYDLKGSTTGRNAKVGESVLKDNDMRKHLPNSRIALTPKVRERLKEQVERDCTFLSSMKIMDYSMLIGIHYLPTKKSIAKNEIVGGLNFRHRDKNKISKPLPITRTSSEPTESMTPNESRHHRMLSSGHKRHSSSSSADAFFNIRSQNGRAPSDRKMEFASRDGTFDVLKTAENGGSFHELMSPTSQSVEKQYNALACDISSINSGSSVGVEDDEGSFLEARTIISESDWAKERARAERRRELAIEQNYWPFHRHFELNGDRRLLALRSVGPEMDETDEPDRNASKDEDEMYCSKCLGDPQDFDIDLNEVREKIKLDDFVPPISNRKDGGLSMDVSGIELPLKVSAGGKTIECDGKIFYLGIIDILQQFNGRKRLEARWRVIQGSNKEASCVHPEVYAKRFVDFFDQYTVGRIDEEEK